MSGDHLLFVCLVVVSGWMLLSDVLHGWGIPEHNNSNDGDEKGGTASGGAHMSAFHGSLLGRMGQY